LKKHMLSLDTWLRLMREDAEKAIEATGELIILIEGVELDVFFPTRSRCEGTSLEVEGVIEVA
jgi:hypothetical protein